MIPLLLSLALLSPGSAFGASYCTEIEKIRKNVQECHDNAVYSDHAIGCVKKLKAAVNVAMKEMSGGLIGNQTQPSQAQLDSFRDTQFNLGRAQATLAGLLLQAAAAKKEVKSYLNDIVFPVDFEVPEIRGKDPQAFLKANDCYQDNKVAIETVLEDIGQVEADLKQAEKAMIALGKKMNKREGKLDVASPQPALESPKHTKNAPSGTGPKAPKQRKSDITGVKEKKSEKK